MEYNFTLLKSKANCDLVITIATKEKDNQEWRKKLLERLTSSSTETVEDIQAKLDSLNAELSYLDAIITTLSEGELKQQNIISWKKADYRKSILTNRKNSYGAVAALDKQYDIGCLEKLIEETGIYISLVTARRNEL